MIEEPELTWADWEISRLQLQTTKECLELERMRVNLLGHSPAALESTILLLDKKIFEVDSSLKTLQGVKRKKRTLKDRLKVFLYKWSTAHRFNLNE